MTNNDLSPEEVELMESVDWTRRVWPRADQYEDAPGKWTLTIEGTEQEFVTAHKALLDAGFQVRDEDEEYVREESV